MSEVVRGGVQARHTKFGGFFEYVNGRDQTGERFEKALSITLNSVVFRSSGQDLTTAGSYIEMISRLTEPVLLGLAVLAVRNRVKR
ncbi:hypothetical protein YW3DRAFT_06452 [Streptomyces sp. MnatMP-M77]|uniref:hypothetical protein n=1 Tax=unclassified Streptomyces TaxID=2593676 RepID=UPI0008048D94|nr:hypothetical protein [Streptomyces sp. MnatMP-M77]MYT77471.1 hypothetical protein [Streptomyces sp. SID8364]SBU99101.1 hypothetical protein YW3DRAFT_06452 [Streptomyces sp. MnatMP-M77]